MTKLPDIRDRSVVRLSVTPSTKYSCSGLPPILAKGSTTIDRRGAEAGGDVFEGGAVSAGSTNLPTSRENIRIGSAIFLSRVSPRSTTARLSRALTCRYASSERQIDPG